MSKNENSGGPSIPSPDEARDWLKKHMANAPERSEQWYRDVLDIYRAGRRETVAPLDRAS